VEVLRLGVAGLGRGFMLTLPALIAHPGVVLAGATDLRPEALQRFSEEFGAPGYATLDELLQDETIDAVYIATPHDLHAVQTLAALRAGKHVLVEKPMATSVEDCLAMAGAAREAGLALIVGPSHGFDEQVRTAASLVASREFGQVRMVTALNFTDFMFRPRRPEELDPARGGGVVFSQAAHQIDVVRRLVGSPVTGIRAVTANWDSQRPSDGAYTALMTFEGGAAASLSYSGYAHYDSDELLGWISELGQTKDPELYGQARRQLARIGTEGEQSAKAARTYGGDGPRSAKAPHHEHFGFIIVSCEKADMKLLPTGIEIYENERRIFHPIAPPKVPRAAVLEEFVAAVAGRPTGLHDGQWGLETMACCRALIMSSSQGTDVDPRKIITDLQVENFK
jgi:phthalate 4,5-cis-dihydrodiol dehydrogenase